jgi:hypothetical protein
VITTHKPKTSEIGSGDVDWLGIVKQHVQSIRSGVVQIVLYDTRVVHVERRERTRFDAGKTANDARADSESETER